MRTVYLNRRNNINSLFGTYNIRRNNNDIGFDRDFDPTTKDFILRNTGLAKEIKSIQRGIGALNDPQEYLIQKNNDLARIADEVQLKFQNEYVFLMDRGRSQDEATREALALATEHKKKLYNEHLYNYPTKIREPTLAKKEI